jgi:hypothetical protein
MRFAASIWSRTTSRPFLFKSGSAMRRTSALVTVLALAIGMLGHAQGPATPSATQLPPFVAEQDLHLAEYVVSQIHGPTVGPIPLRVGSRVVGAIYDRFLVALLAARAAEAAGEVVTAASLQSMPIWATHRMVIVAYPIDCDGNPDLPLAVRFRPGIPIPLPAPQPSIRGKTAQWLPSVEVAADALVAPFGTMPFANAHVEVDYAAPACHGAATTASFDLGVVASSAGRGLNAIQLPESATSLPSPTTVRVGALIDLSGHLRSMSLVQGPQELGSTAMAALSAQRFTPSTVNGVPVVENAFIGVVFTSTGAPGPMTPMGPIPGLGNRTTVTTRIAVPAGARPLGPGTAVATTPPMDIGLRDANFARLSIELAATGPAKPVSLDADGSFAHGSYFDRFAMQVLEARAAAQDGRSLDPLAPPAGVVAHDAVVVATPIDCGHPVAPTAIEMSDVNGSLAPVGSLLAGSSLADRLPGVSVAVGAIGQVFHAPASPSTTVTVSYAEAACPGGGRTIAFAIQRAMAQPLVRAAPVRLPVGSTIAAPTTVHVHGILDPSGTVRYLAAVDGPTELAAAAVAAGAEWRFRPTLLNGRPSPDAMSLGISFVAAGSAPSVGPAPMTSSTVNGRLTHDTTTPDVPGLDGGTSRCGVAADEGYGRSPASPIKTGGDMTAGPAREQKYLSALRGPAGQGLHFARLGSLMGPDKTILDMYEVSYAGLSQAARFYLDEYRSDTLQAPHGFTCAVPLDIK